MTDAEAALTTLLNRWVRCPHCHGDRWCRPDGVLSWTCKDCRRWRLWSDDFHGSPDAARIRQ